MHCTDPTARAELKRWTLVYLASIAATILVGIVMIAYLLVARDPPIAIIGTVYGGLLVAVAAVRRYCLRRLRDISAEGHLRS